MIDYINSIQYNRYQYNVQGGSSKFTGSEYIVLKYETVNLDDLPCMCSTIDSTCSFLKD